MPLQLHNAIGWILVLVTLALVGFLVPTSDSEIGSSYLIFFFHFPSAINCLLLFVVAGAISVATLARPRGGLASDAAAASAIEVGVLACTITLVTGSIWAKAAWGVFWDFRDKRLLTVAIMWFTYVAYLALRSTVEEPERRARFAAVFALVAAVNVPLVHFSIRWFGSASHPMKVSVADWEMRFTQWFGALAFLVLYTALWRIRWRLHRAEDTARRLEESFAGQGV